MSHDACTKAKERMARGRYEDLGLLRHAAACPRCSVALARELFVRQLLAGNVRDREHLRWLQEHLRQRRMHAQAGEPRLQPWQEKLRRFEAQQAAQRRARRKLEHGTWGPPAPSSAPGTPNPAAVERGHAVRSLRVALVARDRSAESDEGEEGGKRLPAERHDIAAAVEATRSLLALLEPGLSDTAEETFRELAMTPEEIALECELAVLHVAKEQPPEAWTSSPGKIESEIQAKLRHARHHHGLRIVARQLRATKGRRPHPAELAAESGIGVDQLARLLQRRQQYERLRLTHDP